MALGARACAPSPPGRPAAGRTRHLIGGDAKDGALRPAAKNAELRQLIDGLLVATAEVNFSGASTRIRTRVRGGPYLSSKPGIRYSGLSTLSAAAITVAGATTPASSELPDIHRNTRSPVAISRAKVGVSQLGLTRRAASADVSAAEVRTARGCRT